MEKARPTWRPETGPLILTLIVDWIGAVLLDFSLLLLLICPFNCFWGSGTPPMMGLSILWESSISLKRNWIWGAVSVSLFPHSHRSVNVLSSFPGCLICRKWLRSRQGHQHSSTGDDDLVFWESLWCNSIHHCSVCSFRAFGVPLDLSKMSLDSQFMDPLDHYGPSRIITLELPVKHS